MLYPALIAAGLQTLQRELLSLLLDAAEGDMRATALAGEWQEHLAALAVPCQALVHELALLILLAAFWVTNEQLTNKHRFLCNSCRNGG
jgi:hypothetical protein